MPARRNLRLASLGVQRCCSESIRPIARHQTTAIGLWDAAREAAESVHPGSAPGLVHNGSVPAYEEPEEGKWVQPVEQGYKLACCDCGLVHDVDFRVYEGRAQLRMARNNRSTAQVRRHRNITLEH